MALAATFRSSLYSGTDASSGSTSTSFTPGNNSLLLAFIYASGSTAPTGSVVGCGGTFVLTTAKTTVLSGANVSQEIWACNTSSFSSITAGTISSTWGSNRTGFAIDVIEVTGHDLTVAATGALVQVVTATAGAAGQTGTVTLAAAGDAANRPVAMFIHAATELSSSRASWTTLHSSSFTSPATGGITEWRSDAFEATCTSTWATSALWMGMALEIKAGSTGAAAAVLHTRRLLTGIGV